MISSFRTTQCYQRKHCRHHASRTNLRCKHGGAPNPEKPHHLPRHPGLDPGSRFVSREAARPRVTPGAAPQAIGHSFIEPPPPKNPFPTLSNHAPNSSMDRSEEHTSELQSLMRNTYAVFCLKKKNIN